MKLAVVAASLSLSALVAAGCAAPVDDLGPVGSIDSSVVHDVGGDASVGKDAADTATTPRDTAVAPDTATKIDSATSSDTATGDDTEPATDSDVPDTGPVDDTAVPPFDGTAGTCTVDTDCSAPFNCCDTSSNKCSVLFFFLCLPAS
jgi:hypothetical protein